ncbi:MAG TPA: cupin domain-containing protein [Terracidiphilus sp.]|nr:cupin domain-containing protein [Terracidiphilus sp.]
MNETGQVIRLGQLVIRFLLEGKDSSGMLAMFEFTVPAGGKVPAGHSHDGYEETIYGLEGTMTFTVSGEKRKVHPGDAVFIPRGAVHRFDNLSGGEAKCLAVLTPGLLGPEFFREIADIMEAAAGEPPDMAAIGAVMRRHGLTPAT